MRLVVLVLPGAVDIVDRRVSILLELLCVFLDDGEVRLEGREAAVAELVGAGEVRRDVGVRGAQVGVQGRDDVVVRVAGEGEGALAVGMCLECFDAVMHDGVRVQVLRCVSVGGGVGRWRNGGG